MNVELIIKYLDIGTITRDSATELLIKHSNTPYLAGAYLETRKQRDLCREELWAIQDGTERPTMEHGTVVDLVDHALSTEHIGPGQAHAYLSDVGMNPEAIDHHIETITAITAHDRERKDYLDDPENAPRWCTRCGRKVHDGTLSNRGICRLCSADAQSENTHQLQERKGPFFTRWRDAVLAFAYTLENAEIAERHSADPAPILSKPEAWQEYQKQQQNQERVVACWLCGNTERRENGKCAQCGALPRNHE